LRVEDPLRFLALGVIHQAFADVAGNKGARAARRWLMRDSERLTFWCEVADVVPSAVRRALIAKRRR